MKIQNYNVWTNYETSAIARWIDNEQSSYQYWRGEAKRHRKEAPTSNLVQDGIWNVREAAIYSLADQLYEEFQNAAPLSESNVYSDLLGSALGDVHWPEVAEHIFADLPEDEDPIFGPVIFAYTRAQAIADGVLIDVSEMAHEAGIKYHTAVTTAVWAEYVRVPEAVPWQDEKGRLWDMLNMFRFAAKDSDARHELLFELAVQNNDSGPKTVTLKAVCGPGDTPEPVITIMLTDED